MSKVVRFLAPHQSSVVQLDDPALEPGQVRVRTLYSGISAGTELTAYRGTNPYLTKKWDPEIKLFVTAEPGDTSEQYPMDGWGYEEIGEVVEQGPGVTSPSIGERIWGIWGHREHAVLDAAEAARCVLSPDADPRIGIFNRIGAIGLNVILDADIHLGETVAVFGLGVLGQLVAQMAKANGATVIGVDMIPARRQKALDLGADYVLDGASLVAEQVRELTDGRGADVALEVSGHYAALQEAVRTVAYSARVVAAGFFQGPGTPLALGEEFHHNRVSIVGSQIYGVAPSTKYRWDDYRLSVTVLELAAKGKLDVLGLITHEFGIDQAPAAFELLDYKAEEALSVVLAF
jgi:2-desacetyl-2-hydroxyethyl bacteriochlorophyllide A dehydrogenase